MNTNQAPKNEATIHVETLIKFNKNQAKFKSSEIKINQESSRSPNTIESQPKIEATTKEKPTEAPANASMALAEHQHRPKPAPVRHGEHDPARAGRFYCK